jgi:Family of unknown function (DUF5343)
MGGRPTSCCRIAFRHRLLINSTNWNTYFLSLNRSIKVTEGHHREKGLPEVFTTQELIRLSVAEGNATRVQRALRFVGLVDNDGRRTPHFDRLCRASTTEYPQILSEILRMAYKDIFVIVDPNNTNLTELHDAFRYYSPQAQRRRMVRLFIGLCREAELMPGGPLESRLRTKTLPASKASSLSREPSVIPLKQGTGADQNGDQPVGGSASGHLPLPHNGSPSNLDVLVEDYMLLTGLLQKQLPPNRQWTPARREQWLKAHTAMLDLLIHVEEPRNENPQMKASDFVMTDTSSK